MDSVFVSLNTPVAAQSVLSADLFGANYVYDYERIGDLPWERFDEIIDQLGSRQLRFPGGNASETLFNYLNPNSPVDLAGRPVMGMDEFIAFAGSQSIEPILILPTKPFLPNETHALLIWNPVDARWEIDPAAAADARALVETFVASAVVSARAAGVDIAAIEIGNEYPGVDWLMDSGDWTKMTGAQYGVLANQLAQWTQDALAAAAATGDPEVLVQVWGDFNLDGFSTTELAAFNANVLSGFDSAGLAAIDGTVNHFYFREGKTSGDGSDIHSYETLDDRIAEMAALSAVWETAAGRDLTLHVSEWNVQKFGIEEPNERQWANRGHEWTVSAEWKDSSNFGLKQLAPMLEMAAAFNMAGVSSAQLWSVMYNAAALGLQDNGGTLTAPGRLVSLMAELLPGTRYLEVDAESPDVDVHVFEGGGQTHVFVSSRSDVERVFDVDLAVLGPGSETVSVTYLSVDASQSDGRFRADGNTYITGDAIWLEADLPGRLTETSQALADGGLALTLGAYEMALISFSDGPWNRITGSSATEQLYGTDADDRILGFEGQDYIRGEDGTDWLEGGQDDDAIYGGAGADLIFGGDGDDFLQGGAGSYGDKIEGGVGNDIAFGGGGRDQIHGGRGHDMLQGDHGSDVLRGQKGKDHVYGGSGKDRLFGNGARDYLDGGDGDDVLRGGGGADQLVGGAGADRFQFILDQKSGNDRVLDFAPGVDVIEFKGAGEDALERLTITEIGDHLEISWDTGSVRLLNTSLEEFDPEVDLSFG